MTKHTSSTARTSKKTKMQQKNRANRKKLRWQDGAVEDYSDFRCLHCGNLVSTDPRLSGVQNRNHCPHCLFSQHLDLDQAGDRLSACKAEMRPVGLTFKQTYKKYQKDRARELMLVHICNGCAKASINRIAADDDVDTIFQVYQARDSLDDSLKNRLEQDGIAVLGTDAYEIVHAQLYGLPHGDRT